MDIQCTTCDLLKRRDADAAPLWDSIYRTEGFDIVHAFGVSLPGWMVLVARRHIAAIDELTVGKLQSSAHYYAWCRSG